MDGHTTAPDLTADVVADLMNVHVSWVREQIKAGRLRALKVGRQYNITPDDLAIFRESLVHVPAVEPDGVMSVRTRRSA